MNDVFGNELNFDYALLLPEIILGLTAVLIVFVDAFRSELKIDRGVLPGLAAIGVIAAGAVSLLWIDADQDFARLIAIDNFTLFFRILFTAVALVLIRTIGTIGHVCLTTLLSTLGSSVRSREVLMPVLALPLLVPLLIAGVRATSGALDLPNDGAPWLLLLGVFTVWSALGSTLLFPLMSER